MNTKNNNNVASKENDNGISDLLDGSDVNEENQERPKKKVKRGLVFWKDSTGPEKYLHKRR